MSVTKWMVAAGLVLGLPGLAVAEVSMAVSQVYRDTDDAARWLHMGDLAREHYEFDLAVLVYRRVLERFPDTRWARRAQYGMALTKDACYDSEHLTLDPTFAGTPASVEAQRWLHAGDMAYQMHDPLIASRFYERVPIIAPGSPYARLAEGKLRWIRRWKNPGP